MHFACVDTRGFLFGLNTCKLPVIQVRVTDQLNYITQMYSACNPAILHAFYVRVTSAAIPLASTVVLTILLKLKL